MDLKQHQHVKREKFRIHVDRIGGTDKIPLFKITDRDTLEALTIGLDKLKELQIEIDGEIAGYELTNGN